jgi:nitrogen regulatory protein PII
MKMIRCTLHPFQLDEVVDALDSFDIAHLTVTSGGERCRSGASAVYRGCAYKVRFLPTSIVDITAPDDQVDGIVRTVTDLCAAGEQATESRIVVVRVDEWYTVRPGRRCVA